MIKDCKDFIYIDFTYTEAISYPQPTILKKDIIIKVECKVDISFNGNINGYILYIKTNKKGCSLSIFFKKKEDVLKYIFLLSEILSK